MVSASEMTLFPRSEAQGLAGVTEQGCGFEGQLTFEGTFRLGGRFKGHVVTLDTLVISEGAFFEGEITAGTVIINGTVHGNVRAQYRVEIHRPAVFRGKITTPSLLVDEGVHFEGSSTMLEKIFD